MSSCSSLLVVCWGKSRRGVGDSDLRSERRLKGGREECEPSEEESLEDKELAGEGDLETRLVAFGRMTATLESGRGWKPFPIARGSGGRRPMMPPREDDVEGESSV
jgi:hypothetical protein